MKKCNMNINGYRVTFARLNGRAVCCVELGKGYLYFTAKTAIKAYRKARASIFCVQ